MSGVELLTVGTELVLGETADANGAWLARRFAGRGLPVRRISSVGDDVAEIRDVLDGALRRTGTVVCTGGLGPTEDDVTKWAVAELFGLELVEDHEVLAAIRERFRQHGREMPERNRRQALVPVGARILPNPRGTAPGLVIEADAGRVVLLPGVPHEMRGLFDAAVAPLLAPSSERSVLHRLVRTTGMAESQLAERLDGLEAELAPLSIGFLPDPTGVDVRITSWALPPDAAGPALDRAEAAIRDRVGEHVYGRDEDELTDVIGALLADRGWKLAVAESCTGGLLAARLTDRAGASAWFLGGAVAYHNRVKERALGVRDATLATHGAVSEAVAREMVVGIRSATGADAGVSITGVAGPAGGTDAKPVGTVWIGIAIRDRVDVLRHRFPGDRAEIRIRATQAALTRLWTALREGA